MPQINDTPSNKSPPPLIPRKATRLTTTVANSRTTAIAAPPRPPPANPPIVPPRNPCQVPSPRPPATFSSLPTKTPPRRTPPRLAPAPRVAQATTPHRSPRLQAQRRTHAAPPDDDDAPAQNTRSKTQSCSPIQKALLSCTTTAHLRATPRALYQRRFPFAMPNELINAVLDEDTGELMEYRRLMKNPKYRTL